MKHTYPESQIKGSNSFWNQKEINLILDVAVCLMKNGSNPAEVTVLCPYRAQVFISEQGNCCSGLSRGARGGGGDPSLANKLLAK
jgi:hypothetical protein